VAKPDEESGLAIGRDDDLHGVIERLDRVLSGELPGAASLADTATVPVRGGARSGGISNDLIERWRHLCETSALLNSSKNEFDPILETVVDIAVDLTRARRGILFLKGEDGALEARVARDDKKRALVPAPRDYPRSIVDRVCETGEPTFIPAIADQEPRSRSQSVRELGLISVLCVPLAIGAEPPLREGEAKPAKERRRFAERPRDRLLGVIYVDSNVNTYSFREEDLYLFLTLANHATTAILKERLYRQAITDPLTRLFTRRHFERELEESERRFETTRIPFSLLMVDIDHFKRVNDRFGHDIGDVVLRETSARVRKAVREIDVVTRYGGEEFLLVLPSTNFSGALAVADRVWRAVGGDPYQLPVGEERVSVSVGVAVFPSRDIKSKDQLIKAADKALYQAKHEGRDRICVFQHQGYIYRPESARPSSPG
jgi:diguanylate cyclase (GGDEF)-like protein